jgi:hypothetical protein
MCILGTCLIGGAKIQISKIRGLPRARGTHTRVLRMRLGPIGKFAFQGEASAHAKEDEGIIGSIRCKQPLNGRHLYLSNRITMKGGCMVM